MTKKTLFPLAFTILIVIFLVGPANAWADTEHDVSVSSSPEVIRLGQDVEITATTRMDGKGIVFVVAPVKGSSRASSESEDIGQDLHAISQDVSLKRIISYAKVVITDPEGGSRSFTFPDDFTGLNGKPSTDTLGKYHVFFIFIHRWICKIDFDCSSFFVMPESPSGTLMATTASLAALFGLVSKKHLRTKRHLLPF